MHQEENMTGIKLKCKGVRESGHKCNTMLGVIMPDKRLEIKSHSLKERVLVEKGDIICEECNTVHEWNSYE